MMIVKQRWLGSARQMPCPCSAWLPPKLPAEGARMALSHCLFPRNDKADGQACLLCTQLTSMGLHPGWFLHFLSWGVGERLSGSIDSITDKPSVLMAAHLPSQSFIMNIISVSQILHQLPFCLAFYCHHLNTHLSQTDNSKTGPKSNSRLCTPQS